MVIELTASQQPKREYSLRFKKDRYIVIGPDSLLYYKCKVGEVRPGGNYVELVTTPAVVEDGFVYVGKQLYNVSKRNFLRHQIDIRQLADIRRIPTFTAPAVPDVVTPAVEGGPAADNVECGIASDIGLDEAKAADLAFNGQAESLQYAFDSEEGWYDSPVVQPGPADAPCAVSDPDAYS